jgi:hypothetical protein
MTLWRSVLGDVPFFFLRARDLGDLTIITAVKKTLLKTRVRVLDSILFGLPPDSNRLQELSRPPA